MKIKNWLPQFLQEGEIIACFGQAKLVRQVNRKLELLGGSNDDRTAAREWISLFFHDAVVQEVPIYKASDIRRRN